MTLSELHKELNRRGIPKDQYFLHGLYGATGDDNKIALTIKKGKYSLEYEVYYKERGEKHSVQAFNSEMEACTYVLKHFTPKK